MIISFFYNQIQIIWIFFFVYLLFQFHFEFLLNLSGASMADIEKVVPVG